MIELSLALDGRDLRRLRLLASVSRLTAARALTFTAERAIPAWRAGNALFHMRRQWINTGVRMRPATPGNLNARVGSIDRYMARHVIGGGETKEGEGGRLLVPTAPASEQGTHTQTRRRLASMARTQRKPFLIQMGGRTLLVRRKGKARAPLIILASLQRSVHIRERLPALPIVANVTAREFGPIYERLLIRWAETGKA